MPPFLQTSLGGGVGRLKLEALREEVHRFGENLDSRSHLTLNRLFCSEAMRKMHGIVLRREVPSTAFRGGSDKDTPASDPLADDACGKPLSQ